MFISTYSLLNIIEYKKVKAATFSEATFIAAHEYNLVATKILSESNKQSIEFFEMIARWETYNVTETEQYQELKGFADKTRERYSFINDYNSELVKEIQVIYNNYMNQMDEQLNRNIQNFVNGRVILIDYIESNLSETQGNYLSFKKDGLNKFLNAHIYTSENKIAVNKIVNGTESEKEEGRQKINETIKRLQEVQNKKVEYVEVTENVGKKTETTKTKYESPTVIRNYAKEYENYFRSVLKGDFSRAEYLISYEKDRIEGIIPIGNIFFEMSEFNSYCSIFSNFTDYPTLEISLELNSKKIEKMLSSLSKQEVNTEKVQKLKKLHYDFLYQLSEHKKYSDKNKVEEVYNEFYDYYNYLISFYNRMSKRYSGFDYNIVATELSSVKNNAKALNPNIDSINTLSYNIVTRNDNNSYREFLVNKDRKYILKAIFVIAAILAIITACVCVAISIIKRNKGKYSFQDEYNDYDNYSNYDDYNNYWE